MKGNRAMRFFRDLSLRRKLAVIIAANVLVALLLGGVALTARYAVTEGDKLADRLTVLAQVVGANSRAALAFNDRAAAEDTLSALVAEPNVLTAYVFDRRGRLFVHFRVPGAAARPVPADSEAVGATGRGRGWSHYLFADDLFVASPIVLDDERIGTVVVDADLRPLRAALLHDVFVFCLIILPAGLAALAVSAALQKLVSEPILRLVAAMRRVSMLKDYTVRAEKDGNDEVGTLIDGFNEMLAQIRTRDEQLRLAANAMESTGDAIMITDARLHIVSVNRAFTTVTGYRDAEVRGQRPDLLRSNRHPGAFYRQIWKKVLVQGHWHGEIWGRRRNGEEYPQWVTIGAVRDGDGLVSHYVVVSNDISQYKHYEAQLEFLAHHDTLTRLPNRVLFLAQLKEALLYARREGVPVGLMFIDLDRFKPINDTLGHAVGDQLLVAVAERIRASVRESDMVARQGGDEFIVMLRGLKRADDAAVIAGKLTSELARPFELAGGTVTIGASIGIACYPRDGEDAESLLKHADAAMYVAKEAGRSGFCFYAPAETAPGAHEQAGGACPAA